MYVRDSLKMMC